MARGVGSYLKGYIGLLFIKPGKRCGCDEFARQLDYWGPDQCEARFNEIIDRLEEKARKYGYPFLRTGAEWFLRLSIQYARRDLKREQETQKQPPGSQSA